MRTYVMTSIVMLPLLLSFSHAAQKMSVDSPGQPWVFSSEDSSTSSYLGVDISDVTTERLGALKLKEEKGVEVTMVDQDAPAGKAGIKEHDVILSMNGTTIESGAQLRRMIHETPAGRVVTFGLSRDGQPITVKVQLADKHKEFSFSSPDIHVHIPEIHVPDIDIPSINMVMVTSSARSGLTLENITPQLGEFFGVKNGNGVLVRSVDKGSRAEKAGFRAGDVIVKVNDEAVHDTSDFMHAVRSGEGKSVSVGVVRDKKEQNLNLTLPEHKESGELLEEEEESLEGPLIDAESAVDLTELQQEVAKLQPQMELAAADARAAASRVQRELCEQQKKMLQQAEKLKNESQIQLKKQQEKLKMQMDQLRQELGRRWADI
ncbi:MAG TPA: PDZ domain-containing protein [Candidatus Sulfotelmatobacter sp.]|nr:PDZ domain-containing protein [Candidatus Sulfotelmatobacter sp.]